MADGRQDGGFAAARWLSSRSTSHTDWSQKLQVAGVLNTVTGHLEYCTKLRKYLGRSKANTRAASALPKEYLLSVEKKAQVLFGWEEASHHSMRSAY